MGDDQIWVACVHAVRMMRGEETASSRRKNFVVVDARRQGGPSIPAYRWENADYMRR